VNGPMQHPWFVPAMSGAIALAIWYLALVRPTRRTELARAAAQSDDAAPEPPRERHWIEARAMDHAGLAAGFLAWVLGASEGLAFAVLALVVGIVSTTRTRIRSRRAEREEREVLDAIGTAATGLRAGIPLAGVMQLLAGEARGEPGRAFREVARREAMGQDFVGAVERVLTASRIVALRVFGLALIVHTSAGGNLSASADRIARSLIERARMRRRTRTILAYGVFAATLLATAPLFGVLFLSIQLEEYADLMLEQPIGHLLLGLAAALVVAGIVSVRRMSSFDRLGDGVLR
jgi:tight adherence protein B